MWKRMICLAVVAIALSASIVVPAQVSSATVSGAIVDATGAKIPGVTVTATELATRVVTTAVSNGSGEYTLPLLKPGTYNLVVEAPGFHRYEQRGLALSSGDHPTVDLPLTAGGGNETVTVSAAPPLLGTEDANIGDVVPGELLKNLPLSGRTPMSVA